MGKSTSLFTNHLCNPVFNVIKMSLALSFLWISAMTIGSESLLWISALFDFQLWLLVLTLSSDSWFWLSALTLRSDSWLGSGLRLNLLHLLILFFLLNCFSTEIVVNLPIPDMMTCCVHVIETFSCKIFKQQSFT